MESTIDPTIVKAAVAAAGELGRDAAEVPAEEIARRAGISRATLYRRIGSRRALDEAVRAAGVDPGGRPDVRERAVVAAADLIAEAGLGALTLDGVAARAGCSVPALHAALGGREGLLAAVFERFSPLPEIERLLSGDPPPALEAGVRAVYGAIFDAGTARAGLLRGLLADILARPDGPTARYVRETYVPRAVAAFGSWLAGQVAAGRVRPLPPPVLVQLFSAPLGVHIATRQAVEAALGLPLPGREETVALFAEAYLRAVAVPAAGGDGAAPD